MKNIHLILFLFGISDTIGLGRFKPFKTFKKFVAPFVTSAAVFTTISTPVNFGTVHAEMIRSDVEESVSLQSQLKAIQLDKVNLQKTMMQAAEEEILTRELTYPEGKLIARGMVTLIGEKPSSALPYGFLKAAEMNPIYDSDKASLFILAVGREGPPLAAKRVSLKDVEFPYVFELVSSDLLFPYNQDAWLKSPNSKDSVAMTAILSGSDRLSSPIGQESLGFGISDPTTFAGMVTRSSAALSVNAKIDMKLYSESELTLLSSIDSELDRINEKKSL